MPLVEVVKFRDKVDPVLIKPNFMYLCGDDEEIDPTVAGMILSVLDYPSRLAAEKGKEDKGLTLEEIYKRGSYLVGMTRVVRTVRQLARRGLLDTIEDPDNNPWRWRNNNAALQAAVVAMESRGSLSEIQSAFQLVMLKRREPNSRRTPVTPEGMQGYLDLAPNEGGQPYTDVDPNEAGQPYTTSPLTPEALEAAAQACPNQPHGTCGLAQLLARQIAAAGSDPPNSRQSSSGVGQGYTPPSPPPSPGANLPSSNQASIIEWLTGELGVAPGTAQQFAHLHTEELLRSWWEWAPFYEEEVADRTAMFVTAVRNKWSAPHRWKLEQQRLKAAASRSQAFKARQAEREELERDREFAQGAVKAFVAALDIEQRAEFEREVVDRLKTNGPAYELYQKAVLNDRPHGPMVRGALQICREAVCVEWKSREGPM